MGNPTDVIASNNSFQFSSSCDHFRFRIPNVNERLRRDSEGRTVSSNLVVFTIWAVFGGFILHFLLSNYLTVLLTIRYEEEPVDTAKDLIIRNITPILRPGEEIFIQIFAASPNRNYREISQRLVVAKDWYEYFDKVLNFPGMYAQMATVPLEGYYYRSTEKIAGDYPYTVYLSNKKWPLKKVM